MVINTYKELRVYQNAMGGCMDIFEATRSFPEPERFALVDQVRRSSRSVCANLAEAWRRRRYKGAFIAKLSDSESEASETQVWIEIARRCGYLNPERASKLDAMYEQVTAQIVRMIQEPEKWLIRGPATSDRQGESMSPKSSVPGSPAPRLAPTKAGRLRRT